MKEYTTDKRLDALLKLVRKGDQNGAVSLLPLPEEFWEGLKTLQQAGVDLDWTRGVGIKKTVFERLAAQLHKPFATPQYTALMYAEFEHLWQLTGHHHSALHQNAWSDLLATSYVNFSSPGGKVYFAPFVEWGIESLKENPEEFTPRVFNLLLDAAICTDTPAWVEDLRQACPNHDVDWARYMDRGGMNMLFYYDQQGWDFNAPPPGSKNPQTIQELLLKGTGTAKYMSQFLRMKELEETLPAPVPKRKGPRF